MVCCKGLFHSAVLFHRENLLKSKEKTNCLGGCCSLERSFVALVQMAKLLLSMYSVLTVALLVSANSRKV